MQVLYKEALGRDGSGSSSGSSKFFLRWPDAAASVDQLCAKRVVRPDQSAAGQDWRKRGVGLEDLVVGLLEVNHENEIKNIGVFMR